MTTETTILHSDRDDMFSTWFLTEGTAKESRPPFDLCTATSIGDIHWLIQMLELTHIRALINVPNKSGWTPAMYSAYYGHHNILDLLIQKGAMVNLANNSEQTALMLAAKCGNLRCCDILLRNGAAVNVVDSNNHTALTYAVCARYDDVTSFLVKHNANVNIELGDRKITPLMHAIDAGNEDATKILVEAGATMNFKSAIGKSEREITKDPVTYPKSQTKGDYDFYSPPQAEKQSSTFLQFELSFPADLASLLNSLGLPDYITLFEKQNITLQDFLHLTGDNLKELGVDKLGPRSKMTKAISRVNSRFPQGNSPVQKVAANKQRLEIESLKEKLARCEAELMRERLKTMDLCDQGPSSNIGIIQESILPLFNLEWQSETLKQTAKGLREQLWQEQNKLEHNLLSELFDKVQDIEKLSTDVHAQISVFLRSLKQMQTSVHQS